MSVEVATPVSALIAYDPDAFNSLTTPDNAYDHVRSANGEDALKNVIRNVFIKHDMCDKFGITLLHRHFDMAATEKVVSVGDTSTPWSTAACENESLGKVIPLAFIFTKANQLVPFEYTFFAHHTLNKAIEASALKKEFVEELGELLFSLQLEKVLGLRAKPNILGLYNIEFTVNRSNIFVEVDKPVPNSIPTSWFFCSQFACRCKSEHGPNLACANYCIQSCFLIEGGAHQADHSNDHQG